jgi:DNA-directed RNA polymerase II subunit RPB1
MTSDISHYNNHHSEETVSIKQIKFSILSNKEVKEHSAVSTDPYGINLHESYDNYTPKKGGLVDPRLGTCDMFIKCKTCGLDFMNCNGHFGHTELAEPVLHFGFLNHTKDILSCICVRCSSLLIKKKQPLIESLMKKNNKNRFSEIKSIAKKTTFCFNCGTPVPKIKKEVKDTGSIKLSIETEVTSHPKDEITGVVSELKKKIKDYLSPKNIYDILSIITDGDVDLLGFSNNAHPKDLIIKNFPIPPIIIRPTAKIDLLASSTTEDSLTLKIADIIKANERIRKQHHKEIVTGEESKYSGDAVNLLQFHVATYFDNENLSLPKSEYKTGGKPTKSISKRIKSKGGRIRGSLMGKRVDFSGRSVITSDPNIDIDQVGVPLRIAKNLTFPEEVTPQNIEKLNKLVKNGREIYPGANYVFSKSVINKTSRFVLIDLKYRKQAIKLNYGDYVERHLVNGDTVLFNRQPTLHKPSMMGHKIHVIDKPNLDTFRMNVSTASPYNADFDGDEMNIHMPQSIIAHNELQKIANVKYQIVSAKDSKPIIGCVQDAISGAYLMTFENNKIKGSDAMNMLSCCKLPSLGDINKDKLYTGNEIFSKIIPKEINMIKRNGDGEIIFEIKNGIILKGQLDKSTLSASKNTIIHYIWDKLTPDATREFIDNTQRLILEYLKINALTAGFGNCIIDEEILDKAQKTADMRLLKANYQLTEIENDTSNISYDIIEDSFASEIAVIANDIHGNIGKQIKSDNNSLAVLIKSGAKGKDMNFGQISAILGQQNLDGQRIKKKINNRTLPHFHQNDDTPKARGFVRSSYLDGLKPYEYFFHTMAGREGLIDTAIKTATTGYIQRRLIKGLEDVIVTYDGTVRTANGIIIQEIYGDNGIDQAAQSDITLKCLEMNNKEITERYLFNKSEKKQTITNTKISETDLDKINKQVFNTITKHRNELRIIQQKCYGNYTLLESKYMLSINITRIIYDNKNSKEANINPKYILDELNNFLSHDKTNLYCIGNKKTSYKYKSEEAAKFILKLAIYEYLSPKRCLFEYKLTKTDFDNIIKEMKQSFLKAIIQPGEPVGVISGQSMGEGTTQMTLNTKHAIGSSKGGGNVGLPRIKEIINNSKEAKYPTSLIFFKDEYSTDKTTVDHISSFLKYISINDLKTSEEIYFSIKDSKNDLSKKLASDNVKIPLFVNNQQEDLNNLPCVIRLELSREKMLDKSITLLDIKTRFIMYWMNNFVDNKSIKKNIKEVVQHITKCAILSNQDTSPIPIIHIRFATSKLDYTLLTSLLNIILHDVTLKGLNKIKNIYVSEEKILHYNENSGDIERKSEHIVVTNGINMVDIKYIRGVDHNRTSCNDIKHVLMFYGIEAARNVLYNELRKSYESAGLNINYHHYSILIDIMTHMGVITSMDRHGVNRLETDPLARASFEKTMDHLVNAALYNEVDYMRSISSRIMIGHVIKAGTGYFDLMLDTEKIEKSEYIEDELVGYETIEKLEEDIFIKDNIQRKEAFDDMFIPE